MSTAQLLSDHLQKHLGTPARVFDRFHDGKAMSVPVKAYPDRPIKGAMTFVTAGLSEHPFMLQGGHAVRQELVLSTWARFDGPQGLDAPSVLHGIATDIIARDTALIRGQIIGPFQPLFPESTLSALVAVPPPYFPESFDFFAGTVPGTMLVGLLPITALEAEAAAQMGWSRFEDLLEAQNPDLMDLKRPGITFAGN